jgi:hypothetical protein
VGEEINKFHNSLFYWLNKLASDEVEEADIVKVLLANKRKTAKKFGALR